MKKIGIILFFFFCLIESASAQRIVVDTASSSNYLIKTPKADSAKESTEELTFSDRALSIGKGILNRLKARLNLEEAAESIKDKKDNLLGRTEENEEEKKDTNQSGG